MKNFLFVALATVTALSSCKNEPVKEVNNGLPVTINYSHTERTDPDCYQGYQGLDCYHMYFQNDTNGRAIVRDQFSIWYGRKLETPYIDTIQMANSVITSTDVARWNSNTGEVYYHNGSLVTSPKNYTNAATTTSGIATFYLTTNGLSSGTAIYSNVYNVIPIINDASTNYTYGWSYNAGTKALTVTAKYSPGLVVGLLTLLGLPQNVPNGTSVNVSVKGN